MVDALDSVFGDSIPDVYDRYLVPLIFEQYAKDLARRAVEIDPSDVLEVAAGSGVVPRAVAAALKPSARYVVTDLNQPMLDRAESMQERPDRIDWRQADVTNLPFDDGSFDPAGEAAQATQRLRLGGEQPMIAFGRVESQRHHDGTGHAANSTPYLSPSVRGPSPRGWETVHPPRKRVRTRPCRPRWVGLRAVGVGRALLRAPQSK